MSRVTFSDYEQVDDNWVPSSWQVVFLHGDGSIGMTSAAQIVDYSFNFQPRAEKKPGKMQTQNRISWIMLANVLVIAVVVALLCVIAIRRRTESK